MKKILNVQLLLLLTFTSSLSAWKFDDKIEDEYHDKKDKLREYQREVKDGYRNYDEYEDGNVAEVKRYVDNTRENLGDKRDYIERSVHGAHDTLSDYSEYEDGNVAEVKRYVDNTRENLGDKRDYIERSVHGVHDTLSDYSEYEDGDHLSKNASQEIHTRYDDYNSNVRRRVAHKEKQYQNIEKEITHEEEDLYSLYDNEANNLEIELEDKVDDSVNLYNDIYSDNSVEAPRSYRTHVRKRVDSFKKRADDYRDSYSDDLYAGVDEVQNYEPRVRKSVERATKKRVDNYRDTYSDDLYAGVDEVQNYEPRARKSVERVKKRVDNYRDTYSDDLYAGVDEVQNYEPRARKSVERVKKRVDNYKDSYSDEIYAGVDEVQTYEPPLQRSVKHVKKRVEKYKKPHVEFKRTKLARTSRYYHKTDEQVYKNRRAKNYQDRDKDGVVDAIDKCAHTPFGVEVKRDGCPYDRDKDGVLDYKDKCLKTPFSATVDKNGCSKKFIHKVLTLKFKPNTNQIEYNTFASIKKFRDFMRKHPSYKAEIIAYTDNRGDARKKLKLSKARADATKEAMIIEGIDASRMKAIGMGGENPIYSNSTKSGRERNNRIEIRVHD
jgi:outer membrane protein OmpA-like peptidoglycan-associated protein